MRQAGGGSGVPRTEDAGGLVVGKGRGAGWQPARTSSHVPVVARIFIAS